MAFLEKRIALLEGSKGREALNELRELWGILKDHGVEDHIKFDLSLVSHMSYYSGILFEVYGENVGFAIGNGGRYNKLLEKFGKNSGATGFGLRLDYVLEALQVKLSVHSRNASCTVMSAGRKHLDLPVN